jgi:hypothetical protein
MTTIPTVYDELVKAEVRLDMAYSIRDSMALHGFGQAIINLFPETEPQTITHFQAVMMLVGDQSARESLLPREQLVVFDRLVNQAVEMWKLRHIPNKQGRILTDYLHT